MQASAALRLPRTHPPLEEERALHALRRAWDPRDARFRTLIGARRDLADATPAPPESFSPAVVADLLWSQPAAGDLLGPIVRMLQREMAAGAVLFFFKDHCLLPADADCTAIAASVLLRAGGPAAAAQRSLDLILGNGDGDGVIATYFDPSGERAGIVDEVVCANALYLAHQLGRGDEARATERHLARFLERDGHLGGTRYYPAPETFLYFLGRLLGAFPAACPGLRGPLRRAVTARVGATGHPIDLAQRILLCRSMGLPCDADEALLRRRQDADGAWPADALFRYGRRPIHFGSAALSTAFALSALSAVGGLGAGLGDAHD